MLVFLFWVQVDVFAINFGGIFRRRQHVKQTGVIASPRHVTSRWVAIRDSRLLWYLTGAYFLFPHLVFTV